MFPSLSYALGGLAILVVLLVILATVKRMLFKGTAARKDTVLLAGLQNTGKSAFYFKLRDGKLHSTCTSMTENEATFVPKLVTQATAEDDDQDKDIAASSSSGGGDGGGGDGVLISSPLHVVDIPGHERLRPKIRQYLPIAATILFFVDSVDFALQLTDNAEYLYDILTNKHVVNNQTAVCVVCNKSDISLFKKDYIKRHLETELEKIRRTKTNQMDLQMNQDERRDVVDLVSDDAKPFTFDGNCQTTVVFVGCSVTKDQNLDRLLQFIADNTQ